jgi:hypothetical protein
MCLVTGPWHLPEVYDRLKERLQATGYEVHVPKMLTVCGPKIVSRTWRVDVAVVHDTATPLFNAGRTVVLVGHSYGGCVVTATVGGQTVEDRASRGLKGGFGAVVYLCAFPIAHRGESVLSVVGQYGDWAVHAEPFKGASFRLSVSTKFGLIDIGRYHTLSV